MNKIIIFSFLLSFFNLKGNCQNTPISGATIPGSITNTPPMHNPYVLGSSGLVNLNACFVPQYPVSNAASITETASPAGLNLTTTYLDGFGRKMESIVRDNVQGNDLVMPYDSRPGANNYSESPYVNTPTDPYGFIRLNIFAEQNSYYSALFPAESGTAISERSYSSNSSSRTLASYAPGKSNVGQSNGTFVSSNTNVSNEVIIWNIDPTMTNISPSTAWPIMSGYYAPGTLYKKIITNSDGVVVYEFYDNENKLISKWLATSNYPCGGEGATCYNFIMTYYVYDFYNRLVFTLHPKAVDKLSSNSWVPTADIINNLCDFVVYDSYGRAIETHLAGENGNNEYIYDQYNRIALYQKPNDNFNWYFNHYDKLNRVIVNGSFDASIMGGFYMRSIFQSIFDANTLSPSLNAPNNIIYYLYYDNQQGLYPNATLSMGGSPAGVPNNFYFYDNYNSSSFYDFSTSISNTFGFSYNPAIFSGHTILGGTALFPPSAPSSKTMGFLTYHASRVILPSGLPYSLPAYTSFVSDAHYYDDFGREVESMKQNIHNDIDVFGTQYNFAGQALTQIANYSNHACSAYPHTDIVSHYSYDNYNNSLLSIKESINGSADEREIADYTYNGLGQVVEKNIGGPLIETQALTYNIRNQLTGINAPFAEGATAASTVSFGESIKYDYGFTNNRICGGVAGTIWRSTGEVSQAYGYTYDNAGRLTQADYRDYSRMRGTYFSLLCGCYRSIYVNAWNNQNTDYTEGNISYDWNGNITTLNRYGPVDYGTYVAPGIIDNLTYSYNSNDVSNQQQNIIDGIPLATTSTGLTPYDFKQNGSSAPAAVNYTYDRNGNVISDLNKNVNTTYSHLDKPQTRLFSVLGNRSDFGYDAEGNKLFKADDNSGTTNIVEYDGSVQYNDNNLYLVGNEEGYSMPNTSSGSFDFYYYVRDHLGNVRNLLSSYSVSGGAVSPIFYPRMSSGLAIPPSPPIVYTASHETANAPIEDVIFDNINYVRSSKPDITDSSDVMAAQLNADDSTTTIGTTLVLKVMAGDSFSIAANSYYSSLDTATGIVDSTQFINAILSTLVNGTGWLDNADAGHVSDVTKLFSPNNVGIFNSMPQSTADSTIPLAFINYIMYDENFNIIPESCGQIQIGATPDTWNPMASAGVLGVATSGYLSVFMSTYTRGIPVHIDPMVVTYWKGSLVDINHYYPFGLCFNTSTASTSTTYNIEHNYLYQTKKQDVKNNLYLDDFDARQYNPQLGRFENVDPANQFPTGYMGMGNNPVVGIDPSGMEDEDGWYLGDNNQPQYNPNINSQADVNNAGINGFYLGQTYSGPGPDGNTVYGNADGSTTSFPNFALPAATVTGQRSSSYGDGIYASYSTMGSNSSPALRHREPAVRLTPMDYVNAIVVPINNAFNPLAWSANFFSALQGGVDVQTGEQLSKSDAITYAAIAGMSIMEPGSGAEFNTMRSAGAEFGAIGSTGRVGENYLKTLGGQSQVYFKTSQGGRYVDQLVNGIAHESKVGYQYLTTSNAFQISKDIELLQNSSFNIQGVTWHFFTSPVTGLQGASQPLIDALQTSGINIIIH